MSRRSSIWPRKGRGYWTTIRKKQIYLSHDKTEAEKEFHRLMLSEEPTRPNSASVHKLVQLYLEEKQAEIKPLTYKLYYDRLADWVNHYGRTKAADLKPMHVTAWLKSHRAWNASTRSTAVGVIKTWSAWCRREGHLDVDRLRDAKAPRAIKRAPANPADLAKLEHTITDRCFRDWFVCAMDTGCRPGELRTLTASRVNWQRETALVIGKTGERVVGLSTRVLAILRRLAKIHPTGPLLVTQKGSEWNDDNRRHYLAKWKKAAGITVRIVSYHTRHDLSGRWVAAGIDGLTASAQLGHKSTSMTLSTYYHPSDASLASAADLGSRKRRARPEKSTRGAAARSKQASRSPKRSGARPAKRR